VKAKTGIGHPVFVHFLAPIREEQPQEEIDYTQFKDMLSDAELLAKGEDEAYVLKQCLKIAYYI